MSTSVRALVYAGVDLGEESFKVCIVDDRGEVAGERSFEHDGTGITESIAWMNEIAAGRRVEVAIETPHGAMVAGALGAGFGVSSLNPKQLDRFRDRFTPAGAKDDRLDARVLGDSRRTDPRAFRQLQAEPAWLVRMRQASRMEDELKEDWRRSSNRLHAVLQGYHAELLALAPAADEPWFWDLALLGPTPATAARLSVRKVEKLLREHRIRRISAEEVVERLRRPALPVLPGVVEAGADRVAVLVPRLHLVYRQLGECQERIQAMLGELGSEQSAGQTSEHRDVLILRSLPGSGRYGIATMLAEAYSVLRSRDYRLLRAVCGTAPVTKQSGRYRAVHMRHACNPRLRNAMHHWAWNAILHDAPYRALYDAMRLRGLKHPRAVRGVADRLLKLMIVLLQNDSQYDPARRGIRAAA